MNDKFIDLESKCSKIRQELEKSERENLTLTRNSEAMQTTIENLENDLRSAKSKLVAEIQNLNEKVYMLPLKTLILYYFLSIYLQKCNLFRFIKYLENKKNI